MGVEPGPYARRHQQSAAGDDPEPQTKRTDDCSEKEGLTMNREQAENIIGSCLEIIRLTCLSYKPDFDICSMYVTDHSASANIIDDERDEYDLKYDWRKDDEE